MRRVRLCLVRLARVICVWLVRLIAAVKVCLWRVNCVYTKCVQWVSRYTAPLASCAPRRNTCLVFSWISRKCCIRPIGRTDESVKCPVTRRSCLLVVRCARCGVSSHWRPVRCMQFVTTWIMLNPHLLELWFYCHIFGQRCACWGD